MVFWKSVIALGIRPSEHVRTEHRRVTGDMADPFYVRDARAEAPGVLFSGETSPTNWPNNNRAVRDVANGDGRLSRGRRSAGRTPIRRRPGNWKPEVRFRRTTARRPRLSACPLYLILGEAGRLSAGVHDLYRPFVH